MQLIKLVYEAFCRSLIRFFDNRFVKNNDVEYYRIEMEKLRQEHKQLLDVLVFKTSSLTAQINTSETNNESSNWQPAREGYKSWETQRRELEAASRKRAQELATEAKRALASTKSTEELEAELLGED